MATGRVSKNNEKRLWWLVCVLGVLFLGVCSFMPLGMAPSLRSGISPSGKYYVDTLPFEGSSPSKLDGSLRLYVIKRKTSPAVGEVDRKIQTDIPYSRSLKFTWAVDRGNDAFSIVGSNGKVLATCRVGDDFLEWTAGAEHIVPDPYEAQYRSK